MGFFSNFFKKNRGAAKKLTKREFTESFAKHIKERFPDAILSVVSPDNPAEITINIERKGQDADPILFYPDNLYQAYLQDTENFESYHENILSNIQQMLTPTDQSPILLPAIKTIDWLEACKRVVGGQSKDLSQSETPAYIPLAGDLVIVFALDMPHGMGYLYESQLIDYSAKQNLQEIYQQALENFKPYLAHVQIEQTQMGYIVHVDGNYDASLILCYEHWANNLPLMGKPVIALIARNLIVIADSSNTAQLEMLRNYAQQQANELPYALSSELYTLKNYQLSLFDLN